MSIAKSFKRQRGGKASKKGMINLKFQNCLSSAIKRKYKRFFLLKRFLKICQIDVCPEFLGLFSLRNHQQQALHIKENAGSSEALVTTGKAFF